MKKKLFITMRTSTLTLKLGLWGALAILLSCIMATLILWGTYKATIQASKSSYILNEVSIILSAGNAIAAERAPANISMTSLSEDAEKNLNISRKKTDEALQLVSKKIPEWMFYDIKTNLQSARNKMDKITKLQHPDPEDIQDAIDAMFKASDVFRDMVSYKSSKWLQEDPSILGPILRAVALFELRDASGRLGSYLVVPVYTQKPITVSARESFSRTDEQVNMLWQFLGMANFPGKEQSLAKIQNEAWLKFLQDGRPLINQLILEGNSININYSHSVYTLTQRYSSTLSFLDMWLSTYLSQLVNEYEKRTKHEVILFFIVFALMMITMLIISSNILLVHVHILKPLIKASEAVVGMAKGKFIPFRNDAKKNHEIQILSDALNTLRIHLQERQELIQQLQLLAETDGLTSLMNRLTFEKKGKALLTEQSGNNRLFLILMDLDLFKSINDKYGHQAGDNVLMAVSRTLQDNVREEDLIGRLGGEEFGILIKAQDVSQVLTLAERIQYELHYLNILSPKGQRIPVTASFGISGTPQESWHSLVFSADDALYQAKRAGRNQVIVAK
ncbi:diguanylate cyclase [Serratia nevei]|uniref:diguanylate cyclase n=1 Tax=Serratia nevei TaxID=2703794 RepID=UPI003FA740BC